MARCVEPIRYLGRRSLAGQVELMATLAEPELEQKRFFCENCERELFLNAAYCDKCGGEIEWPEKYVSIFSEKARDKQSRGDEEED